MTQLSRNLLRQQREQDNNFIAGERRKTQSTGVRQGVFQRNIGQYLEIRTAAGPRLVSPVTNAGQTVGQVMQITGRNIASARSPAAAPARQPLGRGVV